MIKLIFYCFLTFVVLMNLHLFGNVLSATWHTACMVFYFAIGIALTL